METTEEVVAEEEIAEPGTRAYRSRAKRTLDVLGASAGLVLGLPILVVIAIAIFVDSGRPILYSQERLGVYGQRFRIWKFRTMIPGAEQARAGLASLNEAPFPAFKIRRDPRCTRLGYWLRRASLDELPQLWNVLIGNMSLVGPRPPLPAEVAHYSREALRRLDVRPGLTCTWQVTNRHSDESGFDDWVRMDVDYIDNWSLHADLLIILRTATVVLRLSGA